MGAAVLTRLYAAHNEWGSPTDVDRGAVTLSTSGDGRATGRLYRNIRQIPAKYAVATGGIVAVYDEMTEEPETEVFVVEAPTESLPAIERQANQVGGPDVSREGPYDVYDVPPESGQSPLILSSMPGCQYRMTSYDDRDSRVDLDPAYGIHLHDPRMMEYMGAPESARLLGRTPEYWLEHMGCERTVAAALRLHHNASLIMTSVQVMAQFVTSLNRTASEVMRVVYEKRPFPTDVSQYMTPVRRFRRAAHYMAAMGLWRPTSEPVFPGPVPVSSCNSCMSCEDCFPDVPV